MAKKKNSGLVSKAKNAAKKAVKLNEKGMKISKKVQKELRTAGLIMAKGR